MGKGSCALLALATSALLAGCQATPPETPLAQLRGALQQTAKLLAEDAMGDDRFGVSVALSKDGNTALVGAHFESEESTGLLNNGAAYVFVRSGGNWMQQAKLQATDAASDDRFGGAVALSDDGNTALIGAALVNQNDTIQDTGAAYVYTRSGETWSFQEKLKAMTPGGGDEFGFAVALSKDGNEAAIGAPFADAPLVDSGAVYIFRRDMNNWTQEAILTATGAASGDYLGYAVGMSASGDRVVLGAIGVDDGGFADTGAAYVWRRDTGSWMQESQVWPGDRQGGDQFGVGIAMSAAGDRILVGAQLADVGGIVDSGAAYTFVIDISGWLEEQKFLASDPGPADYFGFSLGLSAAGDRALIGARFHDDDGFSNNGAGYAFIRSGGSWAPQGKLLVADKDTDDRFTRSIALISAGNRALIGAQLEDSGTTVDQGTAYEYFLGELNGTSCALGSDCASGFCVDGVCCDTSCGGGLDNDCQACSAAKQENGSDGTCGAAKKTVLCRPAAGVCDQAESCDGNSTLCPTDRKREGQVCRAAIGPCDKADLCDSVNNNCVDAVQPAGTTCKAAGASMICDPADICDGQRKLCPARQAAPGTSCGANMTCKLNGICS